MQVPLRATSAATFAAENKSGEKRVVEEVVEVEEHLGRSVPFLLNKHSPEACRMLVTKMTDSQVNKKASTILNAAPDPSDQEEDDCENPAIDTKKRGRGKSKAKAQGKGKAQKKKKTEGASLEADHEEVMQFADRPWLSDVFMSVSQALAQCPAASVPAVQRCKGALYSLCLGFAWKGSAQLAGKTVTSWSQLRSDIRSFIFSTFGNGSMSASGPGTGIFSEAEASDKLLALVSHHEAAASVSSDPSSATRSHDAKFEASVLAVKDDLMAFLAQNPLTTPHKFHPALHAMILNCWQLCRADSVANAMGEMNSLSVAAMTKMVYKSVAEALRPEWIELVSKVCESIVNQEEMPDAARDIWPSSKDMEVFAKYRSFYANRIFMEMAENFTLKFAPHPITFEQSHLIANLPKNPAMFYAMDVQLRDVEQWSAFFTQVLLLLGQSDTMPSPATQQRVVAEVAKSLCVKPAMAVKDLAKTPPKQACTFVCFYFVIAWLLLDQGVSLLLQANVDPGAGGSREERARCQ